MQFVDDGYIVNMRKYGESSLILTILSKNHGKLTGFVKHCLNKKNLGTFQLGNLVSVDVYSRLEENMPSFKVELITPYSVFFMKDAIKLQSLSAFCALVNVCMPERQDLESFYHYVENLFKQIDEENWLTYYSLFEFYLLDFLGVGLDLSECSATGVTENLEYVSPKTGKAVCAASGEAYKNRLFKFPHFVMDSHIQPNKENIIDLLKMTEFFLRKNFFNSHNLKFPQSRANLAEIVSNMAV